MVVGRHSVGEYGRERDGRERRLLRLKIYNKNNRAINMHRGVTWVLLC